MISKIWCVWAARAKKRKPHFLLGIWADGLSLCSEVTLEDRSRRSCWKRCRPGGCQGGRIWFPVGPVVPGHPLPMLTARRRAGNNVYFIKTLSFKNVQEQLIIFYYWFCWFLLYPLKPTNNLQIANWKQILRLLHRKDFSYLLISFFSFSYIAQRSIASPIPPK